MNKLVSISKGFCKAVTEDSKIEKQFYAAIIDERYKRANIYLEIDDTISHSSISIQYFESYSKLIEYVMERDKKYEILCQTQ